MKYHEWKLHICHMVKLYHLSSFLYDFWEAHPCKHNKLLKKKIVYLRPNVSVLTYPICCSPHNKTTSPQTKEQINKLLGRINGPAS